MDGWERTGAESDISDTQQSVTRFVTHSKQLGERAAGRPRVDPVAGAADRAGGLAGAAARRRRTGCGRRGRPRPSSGRRGYTLNRNSTTSPSAIT